MIVENVDIDSFVKKANNDKSGHGLSVILNTKAKFGDFIRWDKVLEASAHSLDQEALCFLLRTLWRMYPQEQDGNKVYDLFRKCDKKILMSNDEQKKLENLPDKVVAYRGSSNINTGVNISWSLNEKKAQWFNGGIFVKAEIDKSLIAAYIESEEEIICPPSFFLNEVKKKYKN